MAIDWYIVGPIAAFLVLYLWWQRPRLIPIDPRTKRPYGDHGTALDAIEFALELVSQGGGPGDGEDFLRAWRDGSAPEEYPEFYEALGANERRNYAE